MRAAVAFLFSALLMLPTARAEEEDVSFERDIRPLLKTHCFQCHGEEPEVRGSLDVRLVRFLLAGGDSGPAIAAGNRDESLLYERVADGDMPPQDDKHLAPAEVELIGRWIDAGAPTLRPEPDSLDGGYITEEERSHWAFQPIQRPTLPRIQHPGRVRTPVDAFVLSRLEDQGFALAEDAPRRTLVRRLFFDLLGLPPSPEQIDRFLADESPGAYERLVDRLLASPAYGERWARHWLDVAGYADSEGYSVDDVQRPHAWRYRDYVVRAFNGDMPFDRFLTEQLAGDELVTSPLNNLTPADADLLTATGFLRMAPDGTSGKVDDANIARNDVMAETIKVVSTSLLGLTVGCAQCHDHRYDPISQTDYYAFRAIFEPALDWKNWRSPPKRLVSLYTDSDREQAAEIEVEAKKIDAERAKKQQEFINATFEKELAKLPEEIRAAARLARDTADKDRTDEQKQLLKEHPSLNVSAGSLYLYDRKAADELKAMAEQAKKVRDTKPKEEFVRALTEVPGTVPATFLFFRGDHEQPRDELAPADLSVVSRGAHDSVIPTNDGDRSTTGRRLALARQLTDRTHPLTSRVLVNRVWLNLFGQGIVRTPGDFGTLGAPPTHPELLDWLASEFMDNGWSMKRLLRQIVTSTAYRQSAQAETALINADPDNRLWGRTDLRRLDAESFRDAILSVSGTLRKKMAGPPVPIMADRVGRWVLGIENLNAGRPGKVIPLKGEDYRRSLYVQARRSRPLAVLSTFDWPRMAPNCQQRHASTVAPQSLMLMNSNFIIEQSEQFAQRLSAAAQATDEQLALAWTLAYGRPPTADEQADAIQFLLDQASVLTPSPAEESSETAEGGKTPEISGPSPSPEALAVLCQMLLSSNEFLYVE